MFIRAQFTSDAFINLLRFRTANAARPCEQLLRDLSVPGQPAIQFFIKSFQLQSISNLSLTPLTTAVNYPNNAAPVVQTFQRQRLMLDLNFNVAVAFLDPNLDPFPDSTGTGVATVAVELDIAGGADVLNIQVIAANAQIDVVYPPLPAIEGSQIIDVSDDAKNLLVADSSTIGLIDQIGSLSTAEGASFTVRHADLGFNPQTGIVEMRVELTGLPQDQALASWTQFYANGFDTLQANSPWALFFDQRLMGAIISQQLTKQLAGRNDFRPEGPLSVSWDPGFPGFHLSLRGEALNACQCLWGKIDVDVRVSIDIKFSAVGNNLQADLWIDGHPTDATQVICCVLTAIIFFPIIGLDLAQSGKISWYEYLVGMVLGGNPILLLVGAVIVLNNATLPPPTDPRCQQDSGNDKHLICTVPVPQLTQQASCPGPALSMTVNAVTGRGDGLVFSGTASIPQEIEPTIGIDIQQFRYFAPSCSCSGPSPQGERFSALIFVSRASGSFDFRVCKVEVLAARSLIHPLGAMTVDIEIHDVTCPYGAWITVSVPFAQYNYQPMRVLITTTHGAQHVILAPAAALSDSQRTTAQLAAAAACISQCYAKTRPWNVKWLIDPAPYVEQNARVRQLWTLAGRVVSEVAIQHAAATVITVQPAQNQAFQYAFLSGSPAIQVVQNPAEDSALGGADLHAVQSLLAIDQQLTLSGAVMGVDAVRMSAVKWVLIYQADQVSIYAVSDFGQLGLVRKIDTQRALWVRRAGTVLSWGAPGGPNRSIDLGEGQPTKASQPSVAAHLPSRGGCGCGGSATVTPWQPQPAANTLPERTFDFMLQKETGCAVVRSSSRLSGGYWITSFDNVVVYQAADPKLINASSLTADVETGAMLTRVGSNVFLARGDRENTVEVLRVLSTYQI